MRNMTRWVVLLIGLAGLGSIASAQCGQSCNCPERRTISAPGTAQVTVDADLAIVRVGYKLYGADAKASYDHATEVSNAIMNALTAAGISRTAIESTSQVLQHTQIYDLQQFPMGSEDRERRQFTVSQSWIIRVKPDQAGSTLDTAVGAGANEGGWIQWVVQDPAPLQAKASAQATANARQVAEQIAVKSGIHLGHLVSVTQNQGPMGGYVGTISAIGGSTFGMGDAVMVSGLMPGQNQQLAINSRRVEFKATVFAVFAIQEEGTPAK